MILNVDDLLERARSSLAFLEATGGGKRPQAQVIRDLVAELVTLRARVAELEGSDAALALDRLRALGNARRWEIEHVDVETFTGWRARERFGRLRVLGESPDGESTCETIEQLADAIIDDTRSSTDAANGREG